VSHTPEGALTFAAATQGSEGADTAVAEMVTPAPIDALLAGEATAAAPAPTSQEDATAAEPTTSETLPEEPLLKESLLQECLPEECLSSESGEAPTLTSQEPASGFSDFGLRPDLLEGLARIGFRDPTPIQKAAIPELLLGRDFLGQAQTGTGKTAAFALPLLHRLDPEARTPQVLVLTPTRELALQVCEAIRSFAAAMGNVRVLAVYGGADFREQIQQLRRGVPIVVGTPGRVMDHMRQGTLDVSGLRTLVLDEADEMLRMGFLEDVEWVLEQLPATRQVVLFSATMPSEIRRLTRRYLTDAAEVTIRTKGAEGRRIRQRFLTVPGPRKLEALERVLEAEGGEGVIVFARTRAVTLEVAEALETLGHEVAVLNGEVPQAQRERTIERLRDGRVDVLVATDVAARGLDVDRIALVVNYDVPFDGEAYVHRIGRTGRAGRRGDAILFVTPRERRMLTGLERAAGQPIEPMEVPANATINQNRLDRLRQRLTEAVTTPPGEEEERALLAEVVQRVAGELNCPPERLALAALQLSLGGRPLLRHGEESLALGSERRERPRRTDGRPDGRPEGRSEGRSQGRGDEPPEAHMERFRIEVGWRDRVRPGNIVGAIANEARLDGRSIGRIQIFDAHSLVDLPRGMPQEVFADLIRLRVMNKELQISRVPT
jgi:ATP-dependent RNA helicase DeaD